jgi:hypothetical protein
MPTLRPWIGIKNRHARQAGVRQAFDQRAGVARPQPDIVERRFLNPGKRLGDPIDERLAADKADIAMGAGLRQQVFAAAKADLEPDFARDEREEAGGARDRARRDVEPGQKLFDQRGVIGPQRLAAAAPVKRAPRAFAIVAVQETRPRNWLARSVFSQEKPPSASGLRPKWP